ncbi:porin family protein [Afipia massiliensis]|uniref:Porin family protein n=1 Tax=Afipia massiliensis TaxID=211460 RepID=A0A4U6BVU1_9BRAD|nr:outer membrane protein [Afipia massiliensis]TKT73004.1 porin family protein [Afipia massiliensis]
MRKLLTTAAFLAFAISSASAADMAPRYKAPPPVVAPIWTWTGFYAGIHVGYGWSDSSVVITQTGFPGLDVATLGSDSNGVVGGGQIGYNWQFAPSWVLGIEGDISGTGIRTTNSAAVTVGGAPFPGLFHLQDRSVDWMASIRGRLGFTWDRWMIYGTGGGAWADINYRNHLVVGGAFNPLDVSRTQSGWVAGGGVEYAVSNNWTVRAEYLYYDFGDETIINLSPIVAGGANNARWDNQFHVVRAGVNYKF